MTDTTTTPEDPTAGADTPDAPAVADATRYAVYDDTLEQFASPVFATKAEARAAAKTLPESHKTTVREV